MVSVIKKVSQPFYLSEILSYLDVDDYEIVSHLKKKIYDYVYENLRIKYLKANKKKILVYGRIQVGKTKKIIEIIQNNASTLILLIIPNSLSVLNQYKSRFDNVNINYQVVNKHIETIDTNVLILMNNVSRYKHYHRLNINKLMMTIIDESDMCIKSHMCKLVIENENIIKQYHVTATPFSKSMVYDKKIKINQPDNYFGMNKLNVTEEDDMNKSINQFIKTPTGIMLINRLHLIQDMKSLANQLSYVYNVPIVMLSSQKIIYINNKMYNCNDYTVSEIIDKLHHCNHIIFIANKLSLRCISYVSSDYKRHLTYQLSTIKNSKINFIQKLRICGIYNDNPILNLVLSQNNLKKYDKYVRFIERYEASI